jgi:acyl carrier protein
VDGVFHAAGLTGAMHFGDFGTLDAASAQPHFAAKHRGAQALAAALRDDPPAFFCLMSSISTVLGGIGFASYAAANAMLDALAASRRSRCTTRWLTINWDGWGFDAIDAENTLIHADGGIDVLERILAAPDLDHAVVSVQPLGPRLQTWVLGAAAPTPAVPAVEASTGHERPELSTEFVPPAPGQPAVIAGIWRELLGLAQVGAHDNFFELGGHSLLAIQIISRLRQALGCDIPVRLLFDHPTVAALDAALEATLGADMDELLDRIETMPDAEVEALLQAGDMS